MRWFKMDNSMEPIAPANGPRIKSGVTSGECGREAGKGGGRIQPAYPANGDGLPSGTGTSKVFRVIAIRL